MFEWKKSKVFFSDFWQLMISFWRFNFAGLRTPFLKVGWNRQFLMMKEFGFVYDSSLVAPAFTNPPLWPYTLDYKIPHECVGNNNCPSRSYPGNAWDKIAERKINTGGSFKTSVEKLLHFYPSYKIRKTWFFKNRTLTIIRLCLEYDFSFSGKLKKHKIEKYFFSIFRIIQNVKLVSRFFFHKTLI